MVLKHLLAFLPEAPDQAHTFVDSLSNKERDCLRIETSQQGFGSLLSALGASTFTAEPATTRLERFQFTRHRSATLELAQRLLDQEIDVLLLKGSVLAERFYSTPPLTPWMRPPGDIDLLVSPVALDRAVEVIRTAGLELIDDPRNRKSQVKHSVDFRGVSGRFSGLVVELHSHLSHSPWREDFRFDVLFERGESWAPKGCPLSTHQKIMNPLDELIFLASHGAGHRFEHVKWLFDLKLCVMQPFDFDWSDLWSRAESYRATQALTLALWMLERHLALDVTMLGIERRSATPVRRALYDVSCALGTRWSIPRGILTCLLLVDQPSLSLAKPLAQLGFEKFRQQRLQKNP